MQMLTEGNCDKFTMAQKLRELTNKYEDLGMKDRIENDLGEEEKVEKRTPGRIKSSHKKNMKIKIQNESRAESQGEQLNH